MRILFANHTSVVSGAERSLLMLMSALPPDLVAGLACPAGPLAERARKNGIRVHQIRGTAGSLRLHPWQTPFALGELAISGVQIGRAARSVGADLIHANSLRAGLSATVACRLDRRGLILHIRDCMPDSAVTRLLRRAAAGNAAQIVAISQYVADRFVTGLTPHRLPLHVIDNPVDLGRFNVDLRCKAPPARGAPLLVVVGQITPWKGQDTAIRALREIRVRHGRARLWIVGEVKFASAFTRLDNPGYLAKLGRLVKELGLGGCVEFVGEREDVPEIMAHADAILVPSVEEPFGRTVAEAMAVGAPVVATTVGGPPELIDDGVTGLLVAPGDPHAWSQAVLRVLDHPDRSSEMGRRASEVARQRFAPDRHASAMIQVYRDAMSAAAGHRAP